MGELDNILVDAKSKLAPIKSSKLDAVANAKAQLLAATPVPPETVQQFQNTFQQAQDLVRNANPDPQRIVQEQENVIIREDGSISIRLHDGRVVDKVNPDLVPELLAREREKAKAIESGASSNSFINRSAGLLQTGVDVVKDIGTSAFETGRELVDISTEDTGGAGTQQTLSGALERFNAGIRASRHGANLGIDPNAKLISPNAVIDYKEVTKRLSEGTPLSPALEEFSKSATFKTISKLDNQVQKSNATINKIDDAAEFIKSFVPVDRTADVSASLAFKRIAENEGTLAAIKNTIKNDLGTLIGQGYESIPYMIAFTAGGPITQAGVLGSLSKAKARELTDVFIQETGREPTADELSRIQGWSAASTVAEKFGDMLAVGAISRIKLPRVLNVRKIMQGLLPTVVQDFLARPVVSGTLAATGLTTKVGQRAATALTGEATSGALTSASDQIALTGGINDPSQIAFDALSEAVGTVGGLSGIAGSRTIKEILKGTKRTLDAVREIRDTPGRQESTAGTSDSSTSGNILLKDTEPVVTERIEVSKFDKAVDDIKEAFNDATPEGIQKAFFALSRLAKRELTEDQAEKHKKTLVEGIKKFEDLSTREQEGGILGSLGPIDELSADDLQELATNKDATEADRAYIDSIVEAQELADELTSENTQDTDKADTTATIQSFNNILKEIQGISTDPSFSTVETKAARTDSLISQLGTQLTNVQNKLAAVVKASKFTPVAGEVTAIQATRVNPQDPNDLTIDFSDPISLTEAQLIAEQEQLEAGDSIIRVLPNSANQIELLNKEVQFGEKIVELASIHGNTSFARSTVHQQAVQRLAADAAKQLSALKPPTISSEKVEKEIDKIKDPIKGESKETSKPETKEPVKKSLAQEFINPTESSDIAVKNRKVWENIPVEVTNEDGSKETVRAGNLWDALHEDLEMAENLLRCVKG